MPPQDDNILPTNNPTTFFTSFLRTQIMMGGDDEQQQQQQQQGGSQDPLLRMKFHDPQLLMKALQSRKAEARRKAATTLDGQPLAKKSKLSLAVATTQSGGPKTGTNDSVKKTVNHGTLLHQSCRLFHQCVPVLESSLEMEGPEKACVRAKGATSAKNGRMPSSYLVGDGCEPYSLPINILLYHEAPVKAIRVVARAAPRALLMTDGRDENIALNIALRLHCGRSAKTPNNGDGEDSPQPASAITTSVPEELLAANPEAAQVADKRRNFPLHIAAYVGASFAVINKLYYAYPEALLEKNFNGETPLDIAIRNGRSGDIVTGFLHEKMEHLKSARLRTMRN